MTNSETVRQHTVPVMYLSAFATRQDRAGILQQYSREDCTSVAVSVGDATVKKHAYTIHNDKQIPRMAVENWFAEIEGNATEPLRRLRSTGSVSPEEKMILSVFLAIQMRRTIAALTQFKSVSTRMASPENIISFIHQIRPRIEKYFSSDAIEKYIDDIKCGRNRIELDRGRAIISVFGNIQRYATAINGMKWSISESPQNKFFVSSDNPAYVRRRGRPRDPGIVGIERADLDAELYFPLCPDLFLIAAMKPQKHRGRVSKQRVIELNRLTILMANRFVYAQNLSLEIESLLLQEREFRLQQPDLVRVLLGHGSNPC